MSMAADLAAWLADEGFGVLAGVSPSAWGIYAGEEPSSPDRVVTLYDTGGPMGNPDGPFYDPTFQVRVRAHSYAEGYAQAAAIRDAFILPTGRTISGWYYTGFWLVSDVAKFGKDANNRNLFSVNLRTMREPTTA